MVHAFTCFTSTNVHILTRWRPYNTCNEQQCNNSVNEAIEWILTRDVPEQIDAPNAAALRRYVYLCTSKASIFVPVQRLSK